MFDEEIQGKHHTVLRLKYSSSGHEENKRVYVGRASANIETSSPLDSKDATKILGAQPPVQGKGL